VSSVWDITSCSPLQARSSALLATYFTLVSCEAYPFDPEDRGDMLLRNVERLSADYTKLYPRRDLSLTTAVRTSVLHNFMALGTFKASSCSAGQGIPCF
jgi:hypothetical protein